MFKPLILRCAAIALALITGLSAAQAENKVIRLATSTSTDNSGLLQHLLPTFEDNTGYRVHVVAVGTGKALRMGRDGDTDAVLVHARDDELQFVTDGYGVNRREVMYNDFVIVGPKSDPGEVGGMTDAAAALIKLSKTQQRFVSRGDDSGTHRKEQTLWKAAAQQPKGAWHLEVGQGMRRVLLITNELDAYTLTDRATWLAMQDKLSKLKLLVEGGPRMHNPYGIITVNPKRYPNANFKGATALVQWITSAPARELIRNFKVKGQVLFTPIEGDN